MKTIRVNVTAPLIERATQRDSQHCMIAEAITAAHPTFRSVMVDLATIRWSNPKTRKRYIALTPELAGARLVDFDHGDAVEPFEFRLEAIQVTDMVRVKETKAEARADGRTAPKRVRPSRKRTIIGSATDPTIIGGTPLVTGHLSNQPPGTSRAEDAAGFAAPDGDASNVVRSSRRYRQYGRRLLKG
jgi:hypothetical protein